MSLDDVYLPTFNEPLGVEVSVNEKRRGQISFDAQINSEPLIFNSKSERKLKIDPKKTNVLAAEDDGNPLLLKASYGKGFIYLLTFPLENNLTTTTGAFDKGQPKYAAIYKEIAKPLIEQRILQQANPFIGVTEHEVSDKENIVILINYGTEALSSKILIKQGWKVKSALYGDMPNDNTVSIAANNAVVLKINKI
ncbi:MAG: hypothetical protein U5K51_17630 [Flavobacteriaceae bacterium]|nr:hypothetical protein [Flavobacteriaceae bacterium]